LNCIGKRTLNLKIMKKINTFLLLISLALLAACAGPEGVPGRDGYDGIDKQPSEVFELAKVNFTPNTKGILRVYQVLNPKLKDEDVVLIYRLKDILDTATPVWEAIPKTIPLSGGRILNYDFDFSKEGLTIYVTGNYDLTTTPDFIKGQTFRIVIVSGYFSKSVNKNNYKEVISALKIKEKDIQKVSF
jgi:hypothetical protein